MLVNNKSKSNTITTPIHFLFGFFFTPSIYLSSITVSPQKTSYLIFFWGKLKKQQFLFFSPPSLQSENFMSRFLISKSLTKRFSSPPRQKRNASENTIALRMLFAFLLLLAINLWSLIFWRSLARLFRISAFFCLSHLQWWDNCYHKLPRISKKFLTEKKKCLRLFKKKKLLKTKESSCVNKQNYHFTPYICCCFFFQTLLSLQKNL